ncbi:NAD(P)/FAD-dependent oxidoreductase [Tomitella biformata]|uniref:NAD(P)/FAD-dependent oxidoreductase n=1 Tax=Tomitella biformata TaxID=630403 RepID=UPI00046485C6|nr:NAD(P)/FAD-dependent oxidoreductase [Tomitella biformata]
MAKTVFRDVVVVGGGFAGVAVAQRLARKGIEVLVIDKNNYHQFKPLNYQVATAQLGVSEVARPLREIFQRHASAHVAVAEVTAIDAAAKTVTLADGTVVTSRVLVLALGAEANFFNTPGAEEHTFPMYTIADAKRLSAKMIHELDRVDSPAGMKEPLGLVVIGGGPTGVELAGAVAENLRTVVAATYEGEIAKGTTVRLVDRGTALLNPFSAKTHAYAKTQLERMGVQVQLGAGVAEITEDGVTLDDGSKIRAEIVVWAGGLKGSNLLADSGLTVGRGGRVDVAANLAVPGFEGVYVLGDAANIPDGKGGSLPQLGSVAQQSGNCAAHNIHSDLTGGTRKPFSYLDKGIMAMVGRGAAVAEIGPKRRQIEGPAAFLAWLVVHVALLSGTTQKIGAVGSWIVDYGSRQRSRRSLR